METRVRSHIVRLTLVNTAGSAVLLGVALGLAFFFAKINTIKDVESELQEALQIFYAEPDQFPDLKEFKEANPSRSVAVFDSKRRLLESMGAFHPQYLEGHKEVEGQFLFGTRVGTYNLVVATPAIETERSLRQLGFVLFCLWLPLTGLLGAISYLSAIRVFVPLRNLTLEASNLGRTDLAARLSVPEGKEYLEFAGALNEMLARIEHLATRAEQFSSDAAHELRTPLAILIAQLETTLLNPRTTEEYQAAISKMLAEAIRLSELSETLLATAKSAPPPAPPISIAPIVRSISADYANRFEASGQKLESEVSDFKLSITETELRIIISNLLDNALRFSASGATTRLSLGKDAIQTILRVTDEGEGVAQSVRDTLFDRFVRAEASRNREHGGFGIGLALCKKIVESRGGRIWLETNQPSQKSGSTFVCAWPNPAG